MRQLFLPSLSSTMRHCPSPLPLCIPFYVRLTSRLQPTPPFTLEHYSPFSQCKVIITCTTDGEYAQRISLMSLEPGPPGKFTRPWAETEVPTV